MAAYLLMILAVAERGDSNPRWRFWPPKRFSKRVIALRLVGKSLKTKDTVRLALDGLGTIGKLMG